MRFRPTPELRTFGEQINHATGRALFVLQSGGASARRAEAGCAELSPPITSKPAIVAALKESIAYCDRVLAAASEAWLMEMAPGLGGSSSGLIRGAARARVHLQRRAQRRGLRDDHDLPAHAGRGAALDRAAPARTNR